jgi:quercetin dioxygenase-like cupin family protein
MMESDTTPTPDRLRTAPVDRFAGSAHAFDLHAALSELRTEGHPARDGHRQVTILRQPPITHVLFAFDDGGVLAKHTTNGTVTIHSLEGRLRVQVDGDEFELTAGQLLCLEPGVPHDVHALEPSAMLLTVHLQHDSRSA